MNSQPQHVKLPTSVSITMPYYSQKYKLFASLISLYILQNNSVSIYNNLGISYYFQRGKCIQGGIAIRLLRTPYLDNDGVNPDFLGQSFFKTRRRRVFRVFFSSIRLSIRLRSVGIRDLLLLSLIQLLTSTYNSNNFLSLTSLQTF